MSDKYKEIGEILAAARREQGKSLKDASESTKIMEHYLTAVETGEPGNLPSQAYFDLFARSYSEYLGIDAAIFDEIDDKPPGTAETTSGDLTILPDDTDSAEAVSHAQAKIFGKSLIYLVSAAIIIFIALILYNQFFIEEKNDQTGQILSGTPAETEQRTNDEKSGLDNLIIPDTPYEPPGKLKLYMKAKQDVWAIMVRDGDTVLNRRLVVGDERLWEADFRYNLPLGISTAVDLYVNDQKLGPLTERASTISGFEINQVNYKNFLPQPEPTIPSPPVEQIEESDTGIIEETTDGN